MGAHRARGCDSIIYLLHSWTGKKEKKACYTGCCKTSIETARSSNITNSIASPSTLIHIGQR
jgi:hypothetical protein